MIRYLISEKGKMFNGGLVDFFLKCIIPYPDGLPVKLSDNRAAVVVAQNDGLPAEPMVKTISGEMLDLSRQDDITIKCIDL